MRSPSEEPGATATGTAHQGGASDLAARAVCQPSLRKLVVYVAPLRLGLSLLGLGVTAVMYAVGGWGYDFYAYWRAAGGDPYAVAFGFGAYHYAPALLPVFAPFTLLPWETAYWVWTALMVGVLVWLCRSWALAVLAFPPVPAELFHGNVHLLIAAAVVLAYRHPAVWAVPVLTKVTPGVGALWHAFRRDWRAFGMAVGVTGMVVLASVLLAPSLWLDWLRHVLPWSDTVSPNQIPIPLWLRLTGAVVLLSFAAPRNWRWALPVAVTMALPVVWIHSLSVLVAVRRR